MNRTIRCGSFTFEGTRPLIMGIVNVTPDSFSDGGLYLDSAAAIDHGLRLMDQGADLLDIGGESTRPGSLEVDENEELRRVIPVLEALARRGHCVSVDTQKPAVMRAAIRAGAALVNDVNALREPGAVDAVAASDAGVCLMHMQGTPRTMQQAPNYENVTREVNDFLRARALCCEQAGIARERIIIDPGFGFGKEYRHNILMMKELHEFTGGEYPVLVGISRKSVIARITGRAPSERVVASVVAAIIAAQRGAAILRVHDVAETKDGLAVLAALGEFQ